jgi:hypothetical protein
MIPEATVKSGDLRGSEGRSGGRNGSSSDWQALLSALIHREGPERDSPRRGAAMESGHRSSCADCWQRVSVVENVRPNAKRATKETETDRVGGRRELNETGRPGALIPLWGAGNGHLIVGEQKVAKIVLDARRTPDWRVRLER